jgi:hypothetical protein
MIEQKRCRCLSSLDCKKSASRNVSMATEPTVWKADVEEHLERRTYRQEEVGIDEQQRVEEGILFGPRAEGR